MKKYIANIVSKNIIKEKEMFNIVNDIRLIDNRFPTLIVGWDYTKELFPDTSILEWKINDNFFWTHYKNVKRTRYEEDMKKFKELSLKRLNSYVSYRSFNMMTSCNEKINSMLNSLIDGTLKYCLVTEKEAYIYYPEKMQVVGISLYEADYIGLGRDRLKEYIKRRGNHIVYNDYDIPWEIKSRIENKKYMIPFLLYIFENE